MKQFGILVAFLFYGITSAIPSDCGSKLGEFVSIDISDCSDDDARCILRRNTDAKIKLTFKTNEEIKEVKAVVHGVVLDVPVPFNLPNADGCKDSGLVCPLQSGETYTYEASLPVLKKYPRITVDVKWELQNENGDDIVCVLIPAKIQ